MRERRSARQFARCLATLLALLVLLAGPVFAQAEQAPVAEDPYEVAPVLDLEDGTYSIAVSLEGGSGRATVTSPTTLTVRKGKGVATITWTSPNYDYMLVDGRRFLPRNEGGNSTFEIPVLALDEPFEVVGDTTAMSQPYEIAYELTFATEGIVRQGSPWSYVIPICIGLVLVKAAVIAFAQIRHARQQS